MEQLTKEQAIEFYESKKWESMTSEEIVDFQFNQERLCIPFEKFHEAVEKVLDRPVWTHEFAFPSLQEEYEGKRKKPSMEEIFDLLPKNKTIIVNI